MLYVIVAVACVCASAFAAYRLVQRRKPRICRNCVHWDQPAGQHALRSVPNFINVMSHVTPNDEFGEKVFATREVEGTDGKPEQIRYVSHRLPVFPPFENRWDYFGACSVNQQVQHRSDTCKSFKRGVA